MWYAPSIFVVGITMTCENFKINSSISGQRMLSANFLLFQIIQTLGLTFFNFVPNVRGLS